MGASAVSFTMPRPRKTQVASPSASAKKSTLTLPVEEEYEDSDDYSDPEDDITPEEMQKIEEESVSLDHASVRDAGRDRVAPRTRYQYDLFIGIMAEFFKRDEQLASLVVAKTDLHFESVKCPLPIQALKKYLEHVEEKRVPIRVYDSESLPRQQLTKHVSIGYFSTVIQSVKDLYKCEQVIMSDEMRLLMDSKRSAYSRKIAQLKAAGLYPTPPPRFITDDGYLDLCKTICSATPTAGCWADTLLSSLWAYVVLLWNLMARCDRVAQLLWTNMSWYKDSFTIFIPKSKTDQGGDRAFHKKLYCADKPNVCPVLSCAVLFFTRTDYRSSFVFPRADTRRSGLRQIGQLIAARYSAANYALFGCNPLHIAWHHFKRGAFTFLGALTDGPSWVGCKLRADQTVTDSSKPYLYQGSGQDGLIGRLLALLPYGDPTFVVGPPALPSDVVVPWECIIEDWMQLPLQFKHSVVPRFFAVIAFHYDWLRKNLHASHPLFHSSLFTTHIDLLLAAKAAVKREILDMRICTGVPLSVRTAIRVEELHRISVTTLPTDVIEESQQYRLSASRHEDLVELRCLEPLQRPVNVHMRMVEIGEYLPKGFCIPHLSCEAAWRAWWMVTESLPLPLRLCSKKLPKGPNHAAECTRFSRIKKVMSFIASEIPQKDILSAPVLAFDVGWKNLSGYMHGYNVTIDAHDACSTVEAKIRMANVAAGIPKLFSLRSLPPLPNHARPLHEAATATLSVFDNFVAAASAVAAAGPANKKWPLPELPFVEGATQCFPCPVCSSLQRSEAMMTQHFDRHHDHLPRAQHFHFYQNEWNWRVTRSCWCKPTGF